MVANNLTEHLKDWKKALEDGGRRNRLLFFKDTRTFSIIIEEPSTKEIFKRIVDQGKPLYAPLTPQENLEKSPKTLFDITDDEDEEPILEYQRKTDEFLSNKTIRQVNRTLRNLRYRSRTIREEQGYNALYLAIGMLKWQDGNTSTNEYIESPLILVPIDIAREDKGDRWKIVMEEEEIVLNPSLQTKLNNEFQIQLDDLPQDFDTSSLKNFFQQLETQFQKHANWEILQKATIGIFNFQTLMLIKDIEFHENFYKEHPIIKLLSGAKASINIHDDLPSANELDDKVPPEEVFQILNADSSQQEAIEAAKRGVSFVLQGPPGTGKSQTIANIIAESLASGKKVLFVSQKSVALDVVHNRLEQKGLGRFCLEVHNFKKNKKDVINDLGKSLDDNRIGNKPNTANQRSEIRETRDRLNHYVRELHKKRYPIDLSLYTAQGELAKLYEVPALKFSIPKLKDFSQEDFQARILKIKDIVTTPHLILSFENHPWKGFKGNSISMQERETLAEKLSELSGKIEALSDDIINVTNSYKLTPPKSVNDLFTFIKYFSEYKFDIFLPENKATIERFINNYSSATRIIQPAYWKDRKAISELHWQQEKPKYEEATELLKLILKLQDNENADIEDSPEEIAFETIEEWQILEKATKELYQELQTYFEKEGCPDELKPESSTTIQASIEYLQFLVSKINDLTEWLNFNTTLEEAKSLGLESFLDAAFAEKVDPQLWENIFRRRYFFLLIDEINQENEALNRFNSSTHTALIKRFRELDEEIIEVSQKEIQAALEKLRPQNTWVQADSAETSILKHEMNKKRRIKPLRILFAEIPNLLLTLRPCLMMSPLTVSQLLDPNIFQFDIAIFDEASQIPPEYAIGTIVRAKQVIIAGDRHQLPPTNFFQTMDSDDDEDNYEKAEFESILDACGAINMPNVMLKWHYRSEDESLIAFSNYNFYDNKLYTFPASDSDNKHKGLQFIPVPDGIYRRGKGARNNIIEARRIAEYVKQHLEETPDISLGIVTFSQSQRQIVEQELELIRRQNPHLESLFQYRNDENIFVKNLETVQGDERDVILFSIGYGKDETGKFSMNFGPLNRQGGERRLNVAVTRARKAVKLFASFQPEDIDLSRTQSEGARLLRIYMKVARDGKDALYEDLTYDDTAEFDSPFEEAVYDALSNKGIKLDKQIGVSSYRIDFGVVDPKQPSRYLLGLECDGAAYHSSPTARDRDKLRQEILENKFGWRIHRIWSRDWIDNPQREIEKVLDAIKNSKDMIDSGPVKKNT